MERKEKKQEQDPHLDTLLKAMQSRLQELKEKDAPLRTDTELYVLRDVPGRFGEK